jgi:dihydrofolate reductase
VASVIAELSMSLDGFVADPADQVGPLFDWYGNGPVETPSAFPDKWTFRTSAASADYLREALGKVRAVIGGRRVFDVGGWGPGGHPFGRPIFVVTHAVPDDWPGADWPLPVTFVTDGVRSAVRQASTVAGPDGWVGVGGPDVIQQCLREGLLDELRINLVPVLLGAGIRYLDGLSSDVAELANPTVIEGDRVTHLSYPIRR